MSKVYKVSCSSETCSRYGYPWTVYGPISQANHECSECWMPMHVEVLSDGT